MTEYVLAGQQIRTETIWMRLRVILNRNQGIGVIEGIGMKDIWGKRDEDGDSPLFSLLLHGLAVVVVAIIIVVALGGHI